MPYIKVIPPEDASAELKRAYEEVRKRRGDIANVFQAHSLKPGSMLAHLRLYMEIMFGPSKLSRAEREAIAVVVSAANSCSYCVLHHSDALRKYERDERIITSLGRGEIPEELPPRTRALAQYARKLSKQSFAVEESDIEALREAGLNDEEILSANLAASYFNFVNRFVDGLGIDVETDSRHYQY